MRPAIVKEVRLRFFILGVFVIFACGRVGERLRNRQQSAVVLSGDGNFGSVVINTTSPPRTFTVSPAAGLQDDEIEAITSSCPQFTIDAPGLPLAAPTDKGPVVFRHCISFDYGGDGSCTGFEERTYSFEVRFTPTALGATNNCTVKVLLKGGDSRTIGVVGTGIRPPHVASFSTASISFGQSNTGIPSDPLSVRVDNVGSDKLTVSAVLENSAPAAFVLASGSLAEHTIEVGASEVFALRCNAPTGSIAGDPFAGTLRFTTDDPGKPTFAVALGCTGIDSPVVVSGTANRETRVDEPLMFSVTLENRTAVSIQLQNITKDAGASADVTLVNPPMNTTLGPGATVPLAMTWTPGDVFAGSLGDVIVEIENANPRKVPIAGVANARRAVIRTDLVPPPTIDFGPLCIGKETVQTFHVTPSGIDPMIDADYALTSISADEMPFTTTVVGGLPKSIVVPDTTAELQVTALPLGLGKFSSTLTITTDVPGANNTLDVALAVEGLQAGATTSPSEITFQRTIVTGYTNTETGTFRNCTENDIRVDSVLLEGTSAADFKIAGIDANGADLLPPFTLAKGDKMEVRIQMLPQTTGVKAARVAIEYDEVGTPATASIALSGEAFERLDRDSYYRCSTGSPTTAWPLLAVVWLVVRRRRRN